MSHRIVRSAIAVVGGVLLSFVLVIVLGATLVRTPEMQLFFSAMQEGQAGRDLPSGDATAVMNAMDVTDFRMRWILGPGIAALVGAFVGLVAKVRAWQMGGLAALPYAFLFSGSWRSGTAALFSVLYVGVAGLAALGVDAASRSRAPRGSRAVGGV